LHNWCPSRESRRRLYLAIVLDLYTRQIVGWAMRERMTKDLVIDALRMAWFRRRPQPGLIHHSDRGSQIAIAYARSHACAVKALVNWIEWAGIKSGALFPLIKKGGKVGTKALSPQSVAVIVKE